MNITLVWDANTVNVGIIGNDANTTFCMFLRERSFIFKYGKYLFYNQIMRQRRILMTQN